MRKRLSILLIVICASFVLMPAQSVKAAEFPKKYRTEEVTPAKDQGTTGLCWAFSLASVMETELIKNNGEKADLDLSEVQMASVRLNQYMDPLGQNTRLRDDMVDITEGTKNNITLGMLGNGFSPMEEKDCPVTLEELTPITRLDDSVVYTGKYYVNKVEYYTAPTMNQIKEAVMKYGSVAIDFDADESNYNDETYAWYNPDSPGINHGVTIVGWDDNYSKKNFLTAPNGNGAWIMKNSWGEEWGDNGFCYISYYDSSILDEATTMYAVDMECGEFGDNLYQNAFSATQYYGTKENGEMDWKGTNLCFYDKVANVFTAQANDGGAEELTGISFITFDESDYEIKIYKNVEVSNEPDSGVLAATVKGTADVQGYHLVALEEPVYLSEGESFSIVATMKTKDGRSCGVAYSNTYRSTVSYYQSYGGYESWHAEWSDEAARGGQNFYLKAYTDNVKKNAKEDVKKVTMKQVSAEVEHLVADSVLPETVKGVKAAYADTNFVILTWDAVAGAEYIIYRYNTSTGTWKKVAYAEKDKDYYMVENLSEGTAYTFGVKAVKPRRLFDGGEEIYWQSLECVGTEVTTLDEKKITPTVTATPNGNIIEWSEVSGVTKYVIYVSSPETDYTWEKLKTVKAGAALKYTHKKAIKGLEYQYRIYTYNGKERLSRGIPVSVSFE